MSLSFNLKMYSHRLMLPLLLLSCTLTAAAIAAASVLFFRLRRCREEGRRAYSECRMLECSIDSASHGLVFVDEKGVVIRCNSSAPSFIPALADPKASMKTFQDIVAYMFDYAVEGDESLDSAAAKAPLTRGDGAGFREVLRLSKNRYCLAQAQKTAFGTIIIFSDITRQRRREEDLMRLNRANRDLVAAVEETTNGIIISDPKLHGNPITFVNEAFCRSSDMPKSEVVGREWSDLLHEIGNTDAVSRAQGIMKKPEPIDVELHLASGTSSIRCYSLRISPTFDRKGKPDLFIGVLSDITDLRLREAQLFQSQKLESLGQLAGGIAHDFNNVLSIIDGYARISSRAVDKDSPVEGNLQKIIKAVERGASLTRQLLTFGRHKIVVESVVDICRLLEDQDTMLKPLLGASYELIVKVPNEKLFVECAADEIGQIVMNLVINGRDAMVGGGQIVIDAKALTDGMLPAFIPEGEHEKTFVCLSVTDSGTGMPEEVIKKIFDPFFTTKGAGKGTGLGLSIVYGMVRNMKGYIGVDSKPDAGTTMSIYLPLTDKRPVSVTEKKISLESGEIHLDGYTALVAEDEPDLLNLVCGMLERLGMNILKASNGDEALEVQDGFEGVIDFLITDIVMPEINGVKLAELFLSLRPETKVIFMSGYPATGQLAPVDLPPDAYFMAKPISYETLVLMLRELIEGKDSHELRQAQGTTHHWH